MNPIQTIRAALEALTAQPAPIASETGNQAAQGASATTSGAGPLLSQAEICDLLDDAQVPDMPDGYAGLDIRIARIVEKAVRSKLGAGVGWQSISTAPKNCGFLGYQPLNDGMWITAPMYWDGSKFVLLQFHHGNTEHSMSPTHWVQLPEPPNGTN